MSRAPLRPRRETQATEPMEGLIRRRLAEHIGDALGRRTSRVLLDAGVEGSWTIHIDHGTPILHDTATLGTSPVPDTTIRAGLPTLREVVAGTASGTGAFLAGDLTVRGDLNLALALDGAFVEEPDRPARWPRMRVAYAGRVKTSYLESGPSDAPTVIMLHGLGATNASLLPLIWDIGETHRVIAPDMVGFGSTDKPRQRYDAAHFRAWLEAFLDTIGVSRAHVVGNSLGGRVALELAIEQPGRVQSLSLLCPSPAFRRLRQFIPLVHLIRPELLAVGLPASHRVVVEGIRAMFSQPNRLPDPWYASAADEFIRVTRKPAARVSLGSAMREIYLERSSGEFGFYTRLATLKVPALFVWGDRDRLVPASFARHISEATPASRSVILEDSGHVPQFEHRDRTTALVREMLDSCPT